MAHIYFAFVDLIRLAEEYEKLAGWAQVLVGSVALAGLWLNLVQLRREASERRTSRRSLYAHALDVGLFAESVIQALRFVAADDILRVALLKPDDFLQQHETAAEAIRNFPFRNLDELAAATALRKLLLLTQSSASMVRAASGALADGKDIRSAVDVMAQNAGKAAALVSELREIAATK